MYAFKYESAFVRIVKGSVLGAYGSVKNDCATCSQRTKDVVPYQT